MKNNKAFYYLVNIVFLFGAILLINYNGILDMHFSAVQIIALIAIFVVIHFLKFIRIYFILLEERIPLKKMVKIYIKTTFVSIVYPFKIGELFKMYTYGKEVKQYSKGIISVLIDKFFDAVVLCAVLIPYGIFKNNEISKLSIILFAFVVVVSIIYLQFETTYRYLNRFFIIKGKGKKSIWILNTIEKTNDIYRCAKDMLSGRQLILLCLTIFIWIIESMFIYIMALFMNLELSLITIINYISDGFFGLNNVLFNNYVYLCTAVFFVIIIYIYLKKIVNGGKKYGKNSTNI